MMFRTLPAAVAALAPVAALADPGLHHHPHGIDQGWTAAVLVGLGAAAAAAALAWRGRR